MKQKRGVLLRALSPKRRTCSIGEGRWSCSNGSGGSTNPGAGTIRAVVKSCECTGGWCARRWSMRRLQNGRRRNGTTAVGPLKIYRRDLEADRHAPRKQHHTAHRICLRIRLEKPETTVSDRDQVFFHPPFRIDGPTVRGLEQAHLSCAVKGLSIAQSYAFEEERKSMVRSLR